MTHFPLTYLERKFKSKINNSKTYYLNNSKFRFSCDNGWEVLKYREESDTWEKIGTVDESK